jgi:16S rRNA (uracil1498-N3)-methyltransferase
MPPRIVLSQPLPDDKQRPYPLVRLDAETAHYLLRVLRCGLNDAVILLDGTGGEWLGHLIALSPVVEVQLDKFRPSVNESPLDLILVQAMVKNDAMDLIIQKWVELGGTRLIPLIARRSVVRPEADRLGHRLQRWQRIVREATEQCERSQVATLCPPTTWEHLAELLPQGNRLLLQERMKEQQGLPALSKVKLHDRESVTLMVGPEGGWSEEELVFAQQAGFTPVTLGPRILRAETAAIAALTILQTLWGDMS